MEGWSQFRALVARDFLLTLRGASEIVASIVFAVMTSSVAGYMSGLYAYSLPEQALAVTATLAAVLVFEATFLSAYGYAREAAIGVLDVLRSQPLSALLLFAARTVYYAVMLFSIALVTVAATSILGGLEAELVKALIASMAGLALYLAPVAGVASAISIHTGASPVIPPSVIVVLSAPALQITVTSTFTGSFKPVLLAVVAAVGFSLIAAVLADEIL